MDHHICLEYQWALCMTRFDSTRGALFVASGRFGRATRSTGRFQGGHKRCYHVSILGARRDVGFSNPLISEFSIFLSGSTVPVYSRTRR